ncbi:MAG: endonuclease/exonuclease/phosphatase family protein [Pseudomonadota bacterium]
MSPLHRLALVFAAAVFGAGWLGNLHAIGDSLAVLRLPVALLLFLIALWPKGRHRPTRFAAAALGTAALAAVALPYWPPAGHSDPSVTLYQKNTWVLNRDARPLIADILSQDADVVTLQEIQRTGTELRARLQETYATVHTCPVSGLARTGVVARWPAGPGTHRCLPGHDLSAVQVDAPSGPLWIVSLHLKWPYPYDQKGTVDAVARALADMDGDVLLAGDFNMVPLSDSLRRIAQASGTRRVGPAIRSYPLLNGAIGLPIDHVFAPATWTGQVERRPLLGSDHFGLLARVGP